MKRIFTPILFFVSTFVYSQTLLNPGEIAFLGVETGSPTKIAFITLVPLEDGTTINFTDETYNSSGTSSGGGGLCVDPRDPNRSTLNEGYVSWINNSLKTIPAGTIIVLEIGNGPSIQSYRTDSLTAVDDFSEDYPNNIKFDGFAKNGTGGDQIIAFQGALTGNVALASVGNVAFDATCDCANGISCKPATLQTYPNAAANAVNYNETNIGTPLNGGYYIGTLVGSPDYIRSQINDPNNWVASNNFDMTALPWYYGNLYLPIKFSQELHGKLQASDAVLNWATSFEQNSSHYILERGLNPNDLRPITTLASTNKISGASYSYTDRNIPTGKVFYRVKAVDFDGSYSYSNIFFINQKQANKLEVFPNPVNSILTVQLPSDVNQGKISLVSLDGKIMLQKEFTESTRLQLPVASMPSGLYHIQLVDKTGVRYTSRFIKQ